MASSQCEAASPRGLRWIKEVVGRNQLRTGCSPSRLSVIVDLIRLACQWHDHTVRTGRHLEATESSRMIAHCSTSRRQLERQRLRQRRRIQLQRLQEQQEEQRRRQRVQAQQRRALAKQRALEREKINEALFAVAMGKIPGEGAPDDADPAARPRVVVLPNVFETCPPVVRNEVPRLCG